MYSHSWTEEGIMYRSFPPEMLSRKPGYITTPHSKEMLLCCGDHEIIFLFNNRKAQLLHILFYSHHKRRACPEAVLYSVSHKLRSIHSQVLSEPFFHYTICSFSHHIADINMAGDKKIKEGLGWRVWGDMGGIVEPDREARFQLLIVF